jgi:hypothetical protein
MVARENAIPEPAGDEARVGEAKKGATKVWDLLM